MELHQLGLELGIIGFMFLVAGTMFYIYIMATPNEDIPREYFFRIREPHIRQKRKLKEDAKKVEVEL